MRLTRYKKEILSYFTPENREWVTGEIGSPPFDVSGVAYLLYGLNGSDNRQKIESTRRTLETMVRDGLLERVNVRERRQNIHQTGYGPGVHCVVARYGLPGQSAVVRDREGSEGAINGECVRVAV